MYRILPTILACCCGLAGLVMGDTAARIAATGTVTDQQLAILAAAGLAVVGSAVGVVTTTLDNGRR
jgi:hypothetical protein